MMICTHFYRAADGIFTGCQSLSPDASYPLSIPDGCAAYVGDDVRGKRIDLATGELIEYQPPAPADNDMQTWAWSPDTKRWLATPTIAAIAVNVRADRDARLAACDWVVARSVDTSQPVPPDWSAYRRALRDVTNQAGFPRSVSWPNLPAQD